MTVAQLISELEDCDPNDSVLIGMKQRYGSDFEYAIERLETSVPSVVHILMDEASQEPLSAMGDDYEEEDEELAA